MTILCRRGRRGVALATTTALTAVLGLAGLDVTSAAYTDRAAATVRVEAAPDTVFGPQQTWLAGTGTAIQEDGSIAVWGYREHGLSGTGDRTVPSENTISLMNLPSEGHPDGRRKAVKLAGVSLDNFYAESTAYTGLAALSDDGRVFTWGGNQVLNVMGRTDEAVPFTRPGQVDIPGTVVDLKSSFNVFMALTSTGDLYTWGYPQGRGVTGQGALTASSPTPTRILDQVHSIGAGGWNGYAIRGNTSWSDPQTGVLWWGMGSAPAVLAGSPSGDGTVGLVHTPTQSQTLSRFTVDGCEAVGVVAGSPEDTCGIQTLTGHYYGSQALLRDGTVLGWGNPVEWGSGGATTVEAASVPTPLELPAGVTVTHVALTQDYALLHGSDQLVYVYGRYWFGGGVDPATGMVSTADIRTPTAMTALGPVVSVVGSGYTGQALRADGTIVLWNGSYQGGHNNPFRVVRDAFAMTTTPSNARQPLTELIMPGTERSNR